MQRWGFFVYGVLCYLLFVATFAVFAGFVGNVLVPRSIDSATVPAVWAVLIDLGLIALFGVQHSVMARPGFKKAWTRLIPQPIERSTYVLLSCAALVLLMWQWQGIPLVVWDIQDPVGRWLLWGLFAGGWLLVFAASLMIDHFDLFGIRQVWLYLRGRPYTPLPFRTPWLYGQIRHPLYVGWAVAFWATPTMTLGHLLLAAAMTLYMLIAVVFEERDLVDYFGANYTAYQRRVPMFIPTLGSNSPVLTEDPGSEVGSTS
jgi:protein-S-isoprenylcysteine O-methyltransferase Ste14